MLAKIIVICVILVNITVTEASKKVVREDGSNTTQHCIKKTAAAICKALKSEVREATEKEYKLEYFCKESWYNAYLFCRYHGMQLATINSKEQQELLEKMIKDSGLAEEYFWISGADFNQESHFSWISTGNTLTYTNWAIGEPNNNGKDESCVHLWKEQMWNDSVCANKHYFICEKP